MLKARRVTGVVHHTPYLQLVKSLTMQISKTVMPDSDMNLVSFPVIFLHMEKSHYYFFQTVYLRDREAL